ASIGKSGQALGQGDALPLYLKDVSYACADLRQILWVQTHHSLPHVARKGFGHPQGKTLPLIRCRCRF
ncbi:MAG: hypothetical protein AABZ38_00300, partial [candidate division NC10 bacterium]